MTTKTQTRSRALVPYRGQADPAPQQQQAQKAVDWAKAHGFTIFLLVAVLVMWLLILLPVATTDAVSPRGAYHFDDYLILWVGLYHSAIMIWPAIKAVQMKQHTWLRLGVIMMSLAIIWTPAAFFPFFGWYMREFTETWKAIWTVSGWIPVLAVIAHAVAAYVLTIYRETDGSKQLEANKRRLKYLLDTAIPQYENEQRKVSATQSKRAEMHAQALQHYESLKQAAEAIQDEHDEAKQAFDALPQWATLNDLLEQRSNLWAAESGDENGPNPAIKSLEEQINALRAEINASDEAKLGLDLEARLTQALEQTQKAATRRDEREKQLNNADDDLQVASHDLKTVRDEAHQLKGKIDEQKKEMRSLWRDSAFWSILPMLIALYLYPTWYAYVLVN